ncbi:hypothetical protein D3C74_470700 [compost metagenome]
MTPANESSSKLLLDTLACLRSLILAKKSALSFTLVGSAYILVVYSSPGTAWVLERKATRPNLTCLPRFCASIFW